MDMTPVTNPPLPTEPPMMAVPPPPVPHPSKHLWLLAGLAILASFGILVSYVGSRLLNPTKDQYALPSTFTSPTPSPISPPDPTTNWKTYTNTEFKFSFKYPDSYFRYLKDYPDIGAYLAPSEGVGEVKGSPMGLTKEDVWIDATTQSGANIDSLEQFFNSKGQGTEFDLLYVQSPKEKIIFSGQAGYKIKQYQQNGSQGTSSLRAVFLKNNTLYYLVLSAFDKSVLQTNEQLFDQILSTFKFLNKNSDPEGKFCGGIAANIPQNQCPDGYTCKMENNYPDAGGVCTKKFLAGTLEAKVVRSPTCAGPITGQENCEAPYADGTFKIMRLPGNEDIQTISTDKDGAFTTSLNPGVYNLQNTESGIGKNIRNPSFTIAGGKSTIQQFDIDTGIR